MAEPATEDLIQQLMIEHRDLDDIIDYLISTNYTDHTKIKRLKKRKLQLRDQIARLAPNFSDAI